MMMILLQVTDYNGHVVYRFFSLLSIHIIVAHLMFLTSHVTVCVCHAELKGYLLTYLYVNRIQLNNKT